MLLYSKLRRFALIDEKGRRAKLIDFIVELLPDGYPRVTHILFRDTKRKREVLPWEAVVSIDHVGRQIKVNDVEAGELAPEEWLRKRVLLGDVHDSLILDLEHLRPARPDGWFSLVSGRLRKLPKRREDLSGNDRRVLCLSHCGLHGPSRLGASSAWGFHPQAALGVRLYFYRRGIDGHNDHAIHATLSAKLPRRERSSPPPLWYY